MTVQFVVYGLSVWLIVGGLVAAVFAQMCGRRDR
jgi:hypothetical protein